MKNLLKDLRCSVLLHLVPRLWPVLMMRIWVGLWNLPESLKRKVTPLCCDSTSSCLSYRSHPASSLLHTKEDVGIWRQTLPGWGVADYKDYPDEEFEFGDGCTCFDVWCPVPVPLLWLHGYQGSEWVFSVLPVPLPLLWLSGYQGSEWVFSVLPDKDKVSRCP